MPQYLSPGVYVEEVPSAIKPIAGVSTSTAAFIGVIPASFPILPSLSVSGEEAIADGTAQVQLKNYPVSEAAGTYQIRVPGLGAVDSKLENNHDQKASYARVSVAPTAADKIVVTYLYQATKTVERAKAQLNSDNALPLTFDPGLTPAVTSEGVEISTKNAQGKVTPVQGASLTQTGDTYAVTFTTMPTLAANDSVIVSYRAQARDELVGNGTATYNLTKPAIIDSATATVNNNPPAQFKFPSPGSPSQIQVTKTLPQGTIVTVDYLIGGLVKGQLMPGGGQASTLLKLSDYPVLTDPKTFQVWVSNKPVSNVSILAKSGEPSYLKFIEPPAGEVRVDYTIFATFTPAPVGQPLLCTSFSEYKRNFGDFSANLAHSYLTHAVYGYFNNGGTRCYVIRAQDATPPSLDDAFNALDRIEDISIVVAPGMISDDARQAIVARCAKKGDRFAILDGAATERKLDRLTKIAPDGVMPQRTDVAAWYFPWITVFDPVTKTLNPAGDGAINVPPSGHIAGVYARVDAQRGVHKAPANEVVLGALGVAQPLSKAEQDGLNPKGVNCIRVINDSIRLWGARTVGGDLNTDLKYINVKRTLLFLKKSIYEGTQWVVFEPNSPALWQTITRNVTAFLTNVWRSGALFGNTPQEAFYVKCDAETNPKEVRENGQVVTEVGVAIVRPAEFVIFRISQWAGPGQ